MLLNDPLTKFGLTALHLACLEAFGACTEVLVAHAEKTLAPASFQVCQLC